MIRVLGFAPEAGGKQAQKYCYFQPANDHNTLSIGLAPRLVAASRVINQGVIAMTIFFMAPPYDWSLGTTGRDRLLFICVTCMLKPGVSIPSVRMGVGYF